MVSSSIDQDEDRGASVCVLGIAAKCNLFGAADPIGQYVKVNEQWFRVIGVVSPAAQCADRGGGSADRRSQQRYLYSLPGGLSFAWKTATAKCGMKSMASI